MPQPTLSPTANSTAATRPTAAPNHAQTASDHRQEMMSAAKSRSDIGRPNVAQSIGPKEKSCSTGRVNVCQAYKRGFDHKLRGSITNGRLGTPSSMIFDNLSLPKASRQLPLSSSPPANALAMTHHPASVRSKAAAPRTKSRGLMARRKPLAMPSHGKISVQRIALSATPSFSSMVMLPPAAVTFAFHADKITWRAAGKQVAGKTPDCAADELTEPIPLCPQP